METIEFAVKALIVKNNRFLAMHKTAWRSDKLELPGGRMIFGETAEETVIRELREETGLDVTPLRLIDTWNHVSGTIQKTGIIYLCACENPESIQLSDEHDAFYWLATDELERMHNVLRSKLEKVDWSAL